MTPGAAGAMASDPKTPPRAAGRPASLAVRDTAASCTQALTHL